MISIHLGKGVFQRTLRAFGRVTPSPTFAVKGPAQFKTRPARRIHEADSSDHFAAAFFFNCPNAVAAKIPVAHKRGHLPPYFHLSHRPAVAEEAHDFGFGAYLTKLLEIVFAEPPQQQALSFEFDLVHVDDFEPQRTAREIGRPMPNICMSKPPISEGHGYDILKGMAERGSTTKFMSR